MENYFDRLKFRNLIVIFIVTWILIVFLSEIPIIKQISILNSDFWMIIANFLVLFWIARLAKIDINDLKLTFNDFKSKFDFKEVFILIFLLLAITFSSMFLMVFVVFKFQSQLMTDILDEPFTKINIISSIFNIIFTVIFAPLLEEVIFRGVLLRKLSFKTTVRKGIIISSVIFGLIHPSFGIFSSIITAMVLALLYLKYNNIFMPIAFHSIFNTVLCIINISSSIIASNQETTNFSMPNINLYSVISLICLLVSSYFLLKYTKKNFKFSL